MKKEKGRAFCVCVVSRDILIEIRILRVCGVDYIHVGVDAQARLCWGRSYR